MPLYDNPDQLCWLRFSFDPPQDHDVDPGYLLYRWPAYHLAACVKP